MKPANIIRSVKKVSEAKKVEVIEATIAQLIEDYNVIVIDDSFKKNSYVY